MSVVRAARHTAAGAGGRVLAAGVAALGAATGRTKPFHPRGRLHTARLVRHGRRPGASGSGSAWIDDPGELDGLVRLSGGVGMPAGLPDIHGLALCVGVGAERADVLFAGTGAGPVSRHLLLPTRDAASRPLTTLLPYRSPLGPLYLAAEPDGAGFTLRWAGLRGGWTELGRLELGDVVSSGDTVTFDPVLHVPEGLEQYGWVRALREPAYAVARRRSGREAGTR